MMMMSYQGRLFTFTLPFLMGKFRYPMMTMPPRKVHRRNSAWFLSIRVRYMQNREKAIMRNFTIHFGVPSQIRTLDSRSNFFMTSSTSAAVPTS